MVLDMHNTIKYSFLSILLFSLFMIRSVSADTAYIKPTEYNKTEYAYFVNCTANNNCWNYLGTTTFHNETSTYPSYWQSPNVETVANSSGIGLAIQVSEGFVKDHYYTVTLYLKNDHRTVNAVPVAATTNTIKQTGTGDTAGNAYNASVKAESLQTRSGITIYIEKTETNSVYQIGVSALTYTFKAPKTGNYLFVTFTTNNSVTSTNSFFGYTYSSHGSKAPTTAEISAALNSQFNSVNNNINNATDSINNNINDMKDKQDETNNIIKDDNVDNEQASGFFDSFDNTDHGGISRIITAPLSAINKITESCSAINIKVWEKDIELPCGDTLFWNKESVSAFKAIWNLLIGGPIIYALAVKLFHVIQNLKNPDDSRVEVVDL